MKNFNYTISAIGWLGFIITLVLLISLNKCKKEEPSNTVIEKTIINNYYDSTKKVAPLIITKEGKPIYVPVPTIVDTAQILVNYFARFSYTRTFEDTCLRVVLTDSISQNKFLSPAKFTYQWLKPIKTVSSTTITSISEPKKRVNFLLGGYFQFSKNYITSYGPEFNLQAKKGNLYGINYDLKNNAIGIKTLFNLNEALRAKNK